MHKTCNSLTAAPLALILAATAAGANPFSDADSRSLADLSIEQLMNESVTSVSKREQKLSQAPAAIYVITQEDIHRSGATTIAEALRMAPGLSVAQLTSHDWIITSRGFADQFAGKLLVLIDGRAVYTPFFSGVYWDSQDVLLEDLERIEVIRGPGATLWGANAVNGVINIITKKASDTQGGLATGGGGTTWYGGGLRYGARINDKAQYRVYAKYDDHDALVDPTGTDGGDSWRKFQAGFRTDWQPFEATSLTLQGDIYTSELNESGYVTSLTAPYSRSFPADDEVSGGNILGRWTHSFSDESQLSLQTYYDYTSRQDDSLAVSRDTVDIELQHRISLGSRQNLVYGAGFRQTALDLTDSFFLNITGNDHLTSQTFNAFVQDEISLLKDRLSLTLGMKLEHNDFTDFELQPSGRLLWTPDERNSVWASVARAVRTPNFVETHLRINHTVFDQDGPGPMPPTLLSILPQHELNSETLLAYELGYRVQARENLFWDITAFYNVYDELIVDSPLGAAVEMTPPPRHLTIASQTANTMQGETYGLELAPSWKVTDYWKLSGGYTLLKLNLHSDAAGHAGEQNEGDSPQHQFHVRSLLNLPHDLAFDTALYYVDGLSNQDVSSYLRLDLRLGWRATKDLELSVGAMNLLDDRHAEFRSVSAPATDVERSFYGKLNWRF